MLSSPIRFRSAGAAPPPAGSAGASACGACLKSPAPRSFLRFFLRSPPPPLIILSKAAALPPPPPSTASAPPPLRGGGGGGGAKCSRPERLSASRSLRPAASSASRCRLRSSHSAFFRASSASSACAPALRRDSTSSMCVRRLALAARSLSPSSEARTAASSRSPAVVAVPRASAKRCSFSAACALSSAFRSTISRFRCSSSFSLSLRATWSGIASGSLACSSRKSRQWSHRTVRPSSLAPLKLSTASTVERWSS
mmetsp:Transcript_24206/g.71807  ORF Transcript_24206/g.71807 Transcript_24206/m.71807 type:complete len:255 (+) Transcript_24206:185-949(+)